MQSQLSLNKKKILVTGGAGFVGSNLVKAIGEIYPNATITVFDKFNTTEKRINGHYKYFGDFKNLEGFNGTVIAGDISKEEEVKALLNNSYDVIFHQAAISDTTEINQEEVVKTNTNSFLPFLDYVKETGAVLVYASSAGTYGNTPSPNTVGRGEVPENVYGFSKLMMDRLTDQFLKENPQSKVIGLRYFNVYGPGEFYKRKTSSMVLQLTYQAITQKKVRLFKHGEQKRDFVYIKDVVQANLKAASGNSGIYNVGYGESRSFNDIIRIIKETIQEDFEVDYIDNPYSFYQLNTCAELEVSRQGIGYNPEYTLEKGVGEYVAQLKELPMSAWERFLM